MGAHLPGRHQSTLSNLPVALTVAAALQFVFHGRAWLLGKGQGTEGVLGPYFQYAAWECSSVPCHVAAE